MREKTELDRNKSNSKKTKAAVKTKLIQGESILTKGERAQKFFKKKNNKRPIQTLPCHLK